MHHATHLDAAETVFFQRELEQLLSGSFDKKYATLKGRTLVGTGELIDEGAETVRYEQYDARGEAKLIADASDDLPMVNVSGTEFFAKMKSYGDAYGFSMQEIKSAARAGKPLESARADAAR